MAEQYDIGMDIWLFGKSNLPHYNLGREKFCFVVHLVFVDGLCWLDGLHFGTNTRHAPTTCTEVGRI